ncbi:MULTISPECIES: DUF6093 family protein [unclassified Microbacterium]|uniref:DUF6093 family protein n=1 Tax=unclassified Microbacterium TaxID=2609290 RepID=UPI00301034BA
MSLLTRALGMGRQLANARMTETVTAGRYKDGTDEETGNPTRVLVEAFYSGPARVKYVSLAVTEREEPSQVLAAQQPLMSVPTTAPAIPEGLEVHVESSSSDPGLVGRFYRVQGAPQAGQTTSHRYPLQELS